MGLTNRHRKIEKKAKKRPVNSGAKSDCRMSLVGTYGNNDIHVYACTEHPSCIGCGRVQNYDGNLLEFSRYVADRGKTFTPNGVGQKILESLEVTTQESEKNTVKAA
jgi:hypothetical protein